MDLPGYRKDGCPLIAAEQDALLKSQFQRLGKSTLVYGLGGVLNRFISLLMLPLFTAYLTPADYGVSSILSLVTFVLTSVFTLGFGVSIGVCYFEGNDPRRKTSTIWTAAFFLLLSVAMMLIIGTVFSKPISTLAFQTDEYSKLVVLSVIGSAFNIVTLPFILRLQFEERARLFVMITVLSTLASIGTNVLLVVFFRMGVWGVVIGGMIGQIVTFLLYITGAVRGLSFRLDSLVGKELFKLGLPLVPSFIFVFVIQQGNKYILQMLRGLEESGLYTVGYNLGMALNLVVTGFTTAWYPFFMSFFEKKDEGRTLFGRITTYYCLGFGSIALMFFLAARPVVMIMTQPAFHTAYQVVGFSAASNFFLGLFSVILPGMYFAKEVKFVAIIQGSAAVISILANFVLIPRLGFIGAGMGLTIGTFAMILFTFIFNRVRGYLDVEYEWKRMIAFSGLAIILAAASFLFPEKPLSFAILQTLVLTLILAVAMILMLNQKEKQFIKEFKDKYFNWNTIRSLVGSTRNVFNNL